MVVCEDEVELDVAGVVCETVVLGPDTWGPGEVVEIGDCVVGVDDVDEDIEDVDSDVEETEVRFLSGDDLVPGLPELTSAPFVAKKGGASRIGRDAVVLVIVGGAAMSLVA